MGMRVLKTISPEWRGSYPSVTIYVIKPSASTSIREYFKNQGFKNLQIGIEKTTQTRMKIVLQIH